MTGAASPAASFPWGFDASFGFGPQGGCRGYFGRDVLAGLISGIDAFRAEADSKPGFRTLGPAMLGAFMWLDDPELIERIADFPHACMVITKTAPRQAAPGQARQAQTGVRALPRIPRGCPSRTLVPDATGG